jgi:hypothetical protein
MAPTSGPPAPVRSWTCRQHTAREPAIAAEYYGADTENGDRMDDPSEDGLFMLLSELNPAATRSSPSSLPMTLAFLPFRLFGFGCRLSAPSEDRSGFVESV